MSNIEHKNDQFQSYYPNCFDEKCVDEYNQEEEDYEEVEGEEEDAEEDEESEYEYESDENIQDLKELNNDDNFGQSEEGYSEEEVLSQNQQNYKENSNEKVFEYFKQKQKQVSEDDNHQKQETLLYQSEEITDIIKKITQEKTQEDNFKIDYNIQQPEFQQIFQLKENSSPDLVASSQLSFDFDVLNVLSLNNQLQEEKKDQFQKDDAKSSLDSFLQDNKSLINNEIKFNSLDHVIVKTTLKYPKIMRQLEYSDFQQLLLNPLPQTGMLQCTLIRNKMGFNRFNPKFQLQVSSTQKFLVSAQKKISPGQCYYIFSMHPKQISSKNAFFIGKLRSENQNTCFSLYDDGVSSIKNNLVRNARKQLAAVIYKQNSTSKKPREMKVLIPDISLNERNTKGFTCITNEQNLITKFNQGIEQEIKVFKNNQPQWDNSVQSFVLNFFGRVKLASIKNFQLILDERDNIYLQFGKVSEHEFILDFQHPFSPLQAFMIALTSFEYKCGK